MKIFDRNKSVEGRSAATFAEIDIFGKANPYLKSTDPKLRARQDQLTGKRKKEFEKLKAEKGYHEERLENFPGLNFDEALELALILNPEENQLAPPAKIAKDIRNDIIAAKDEFLKTPKQVRFFTSVNTPLDYHGVDAFFIINGIPITLDASLDPRKTERLKADIYLPGDFPLEMEDEEGYMNWIENIAETILNKYEEKLANLKNDNISWKDLNNIKTISKVLNLKDISNLQEILKIA